MTTMNDIAQRTGLSRATVSYVLNGRHENRLGDATRKKVLQAAQEMGYRGNELARAVATGKSRILGIVTPEEINEPQARTIGGALAEIAERGYSSKLIYVPFQADETQAKRLLQLCTSWRLDGALVVGLADAHLKLLQEEMVRGNRPLAFVGVLPPKNSTGAYLDDSAAWNLAIKYLMELGHRRIAHLGGRPDSELAKRRQEVFLQVSHACGLSESECSATLSSWGTVELIAQGFHRLMDVSQQPTAILCAGDNLAMVALREARQRGLRVPQDLSILGFSDITTAPYTDPPLSSIAEPKEEAAREAVRQLLARVEGDPQLATAPNVPYKLTEGFRLVIRSTTGPAPQI